MKRKVFDLSGWARVTRHTQTVLHVPGHVIVDFVAHDVIRPLDVPIPGRDGLRRILGSGYRWVRAHPTTGEGTPGSALTIQLDPTGRPVQYYIDLHGGEGWHDSGHPWHDDLYLDVTGHPAEHDPWTVAATAIIDGDELDDAVTQGLVTPAQADATWTHARHVETQLQTGTYPPVHVLKRYLEDPYT
ncbi:DUF402 domain-containing protein [Deinococcus soli (ex Cha et al. 2016)]|uniref:RNA-binding protein associated with RNAse of E/G family n=2 Tax=Deinococcus soli (ex Cha et al. 2016) TaxID=1309411 RepID=A0AAE4BK11_9DEIO|nr:DUF402 domain-containing protein [Deinococcus soli (ex Cha et al. 2016)]MDR6217173.1 putative RNA-binding protein associated with RNAse of E/G family [Deinococcus soli (ex Cha et al. 2016)]MDR6326482.1 putative RNA-binding protein associated with RNAse of E/G family [Deinococcus soli (ex Cha et al. 2016)]MDR6750791.1 putative RNA-binding protein associated with RNAse of E/G family [Deinococcus soli (ex Cha et al. 2016)]